MRTRSQRPLRLTVPTTCRLPNCFVVLNRMNVQLQQQGANSARRTTGRRASNALPSAARGLVARTGLIRRAVRATTRMASRATNALVQQRRTHQQRVQRVQLVQRVQRAGNPATIAVQTMRTELTNFARTYRNRLDELERILQRFPPRRRPNARRRQ